MSLELEIAAATEADAPEIAAIYAHHVVHGVATFELIPPDTAEIARRMTKVAEAGAPWLVARGSGGEMVGYAYAGSTRAKPIASLARTRSTCATAGSAKVLARPCWRR